MKHEIILVQDPIKVSRQVDGTAGDTSDEDGSDISDDQYVYLYNSFDLYLQSDLFLLASTILMMMT